MRWLQNFVMVIQRLRLQRLFTRLPGRNSRLSEVRWKRLPVRCRKLEFGKLQLLWLEEFWIVNLRQCQNFMIRRLSMDTGKAAKSGVVAIVGIGPGSLEQLTEQARVALLEAHVIVGYKTYTDLIMPLVQG